MSVGPARSPGWERAVTKEGHDTKTTACIRAENVGGRAKWHMLGLHVASNGLENKIN